MRRRVKPHPEASARAFGTFRREVGALLVAKGMTPLQAREALARWKTYVKARWGQGKPPCAVSDHLMRWSKEKIVCPCKRNGDPSPRCKVHGRRDKAGRNRVKRIWRGIYGRGNGIGVVYHPKKGFMLIEGSTPVKTFDDENEAVQEGRKLLARRKSSERSSPRSRRDDAGPPRTGRDADNPKVGEVYEGRTSGRRWEVVKVDGDKILMKPAGNRSDQPTLFAKQSLRGMKVIKGAVDSFLTKILGPRPGPEIREKDEERLLRKEAIRRELEKTSAFESPVSGDMQARRRPRRR